MLDEYDAINPGLAKEDFSSGFVDRRVIWPTVILSVFGKGRGISLHCSKLLGTQIKK